MIDPFRKLDPPPGGLARFRTRLAAQPERGARSRAWLVVPALAAAAAAWLLLPHQASSGPAGTRSLLISYAVASISGPEGAPPGASPGSFGDEDRAGDRSDQRQYPGEDRLGDLQPNDGRRNPSGADGD
jgi:hypothetical protein